tara:strand:+ start:325 stop:825 length:501 start_codon:yes stop_codon:yes gene_type:complete
MASDIQILGPATIKVNGNILGYSADMVSVTLQAFHHDVPGDHHGGPQGPPIAVQYLGQIARIRLELSHWDIAEYRKVADRTNAAGNAGVRIDNGKVGQLVYDASSVADGNLGTYQVEILNASGNGYQFEHCICREAVEFNAGSKYSTLNCEFEAHRSSYGTLYSYI